MNSNPPKILGSNWGISIALVISLMTAVLLNVGMIYSISERCIRVESTVDGYGDDLTEIKAVLRTLSSSMNSEFRDLREKNAVLRERVSRLESAKK